MESVGNDRTHTRLFERLGMTEEYANNCAAFRNAEKRPFPAQPELFQRGLWIGNFTAAGVSYCFTDELEGARRCAAQAVAHSLEYLVGDWRENFVENDKPKSPAELRQTQSWINEFRDGLTWAAALRDDDAMRRLANYVQDDCEDESWYSCDFKTADRAYYILLGRAIRGDDPGELKKYIDEIMAGTRKRPKLLAAAMMALVENDETGFRSALKEYLKYYKAREFTQRDMTFKLCFDGTILEYLAARKGWANVVPPAMADYIIQL